MFSMILVKNIDVFLSMFQINIFFVITVTFLFPMFFFVKKKQFVDESRGNSCATVGNELSSFATYAFRLTDEARVQENIFEIFLKASSV